MLEIQPLTEFFESEMIEGCLELLLKLMRLTYQFDDSFRRGIEGFEGRYSFMTKDGQHELGAVFADGEMDVQRTAAANSDLTITYRDDRVLMEFLLAPKPDVIGAMLRQDVVLEGDLAFFYPFAHMARRLHQIATGVE